MSDEDQITEPETQKPVEESTTPEKTYTEAELIARIEAVRKQEKDKLYDKVELALKKADSAEKKLQAEEEARLAIEAEAKAKAEKDRKAKLSAEETIAEKLNSLEEQLEEERQARSILQKKLQEEAEAKELEKYRQELLREAGEEIIPDLVSGSSREEIEKSTARAKDVYQELFKASRSKAEGNVRNNMPQPTDPDPSPTDEAELQRSLAGLQIDTDRYFGNRSKGISRDQAYINEVNAKRAEITEKIGANYRSSLGR